ncbi:MAG: hypothetical protein R3A43_12925 [Bacteroidia bacterium]
MTKYFQALDSLPNNDTLNLNFKLLKAYYLSDTLLLKKECQNHLAILRRRKEIIKRNNFEFTHINRYDYDVFFEFNYNAAFCDKAASIFIGSLNEDSLTFGVRLTGVDHYPSMKTTIIKDTIIPIDFKKWEEFMNAMGYVDFWGLNEDNGINGFDGSSLTVTGYAKPSNYNKGNYKVIYRWAAERTAMGDVFRKLLDFANLNIECFHF